jgi:hypothetical protein
VLEVLSVRVRCGDEAHATLVVDEREAHRAYRVRVVYDATEGRFTAVEVATWWSDDLVERPVPRCTVKLVAALQRCIECDDALTADLESAVRRVQEDARIYDRVAEEGRV